MAMKRARKTQDIRVVVFSSQPCNVRPPGNGCPDVRMLVGGHGHAIGRTTNQDAEVAFCLDSFCQRVSVIGIIDAGSVRGAVVDDVDSALLQKRDDRGPQIPRMVVGQVYPHGCKLPRNPIVLHAQFIVNSHVGLCVNQT